MPESARRLFHEVEIFCDGAGCQTRTYHSGWYRGLTAAFARARQELIRYHGWTRQPAPTGLVDLCPECKTNPHMKESVSA